MRLGFDSRPAADRRGIGRYARCLLAALRETAPDGAEIVETARARPGLDVFHAPWIDAAPLLSRVPVVVTLHDLIPLKRGAEYLRTGARFRLRYAAVRRAARVIVPTRAVAADAVALLGLEPERIDVVAEAPDPVFAPRAAAEVAAARARLGVPDGPFLLWVGGLRAPDPRKRIEALARAPRSLPLVIAGEVGAWARPALTGAVTVGPVTDDDLAALYTAAHALVLASDDEGFGLPPVEALACGAPVAASDVPAVREVLDGRATLVDPADLEGLIRAAEQATRPAPPPPPWTWTDAARATWAVYARART